MGSWRTLALASLERTQLIEAVSEEGLPWQGSLHVVATQSLAEVFLKNGDNSVTVANFLDLISLPGLGSHFGLSSESFPKFPIEINQASIEEYKVAKKTWSSRASALKTKHAWVFDHYFSQYLKSTTPNDELQILKLSKKQLRKTLQNLENSGLTPDDFQPQTKLSRQALDFWRSLAAAPEYRYISYAREDFWSPEKNKTIGSRIDEALALLLGDFTTEATVYFHGFYFYTPLQWGLFRALKNHAKVNVVFLIHEDGEAKSLETWRRFFSVSMGLPNVEYLSQTGKELSSNSQLFENALSGQYLDPSTTTAKVLSFENPTHFVRHLRYMSEARDAAGKAPLLIFGSREKDLQRFTKRLSGSLVSSSVALYQLPVGMFLVALHSCIKTNADNELSITMNFEDFMSMVPYVLQADSKLELTLKQVSDLREFFSDCESLESWSKRAELLISNSKRIATLGSDSLGFNALRLLPWTSHTESEAVLLADLVGRICKLVNEIGLLHNVGLDEYSKFLRSHLESALKSANKEMHDEIISRMEMFNLGDDFQVEVSSLVEIVQKLVGRESAYDDDEDDYRPDDLFIKPIQALDSLAYSPAGSDVLIANLSDRAFPSKRQIRSWPFTSNEFATSNVLSTFGYEILKLNEECAALGDLYLMRCAFGGVSIEQELSLTWLEESLGERNNPSPAIAMMLDLPRASAAIRAATGGLSIVKPKMPGMEGETFDSLVPESVDKPAVALDSFSKLELSAGVFCDRRFALQWIMGDSPAYQHGYLQNLLYGNMISYLVKAFKIDEPSAKNICDEVWPHLPFSIKESSIQKRAIKPTHGADFRWIYNLGGAHSGSTDSTSVFGRMNGSYQLVLDKKGSRPIAAPSAGRRDLIPLGPAGVRRDLHVLCNMCPVSKACSRITEESEE